MRNAPEEAIEVMVAKEMVVMVAEEVEEKVMPTSGHGHGRIPLLLMTHTRLRSWRNARALKC